MQMQKREARMIPEVLYQEPLSVCVAVCVWKKGFLRLRYFPQRVASEFLIHPNGMGPFKIKMLVKVAVNAFIFFFLENLIFGPPRASF